MWVVKRASVFSHRLVVSSHCHPAARRSADGAHPGQSPNRSRIEHVSKNSGLHCTMPGGMGSSCRGMSSSFLWLTTIVGLLGVVNFLPDSLVIVHPPCVCLAVLADVIVEQIVIRAFKATITALVYVNNDNLVKPQFYLPKIRNRIFTIRDFENKPFLRISDIRKRPGA